MIITPDTLKALFIGFKKNFQDGLKMAESQGEKAAGRQQAGRLNNNRHRTRPPH